MTRLSVSDDATFCQRQAAGDKRLDMRYRK